jgi:chromosome segregation protein
MRLRSVSLKGFKSFPERTQLDFGPGVSVVVGPNGSGKSNVTDAVLWAMGEQSPLAVRGQSMLDVIFGGGHGVQPRSSAEVEIVLDNSDGTVDLPLSEISIVRRLDRSGEGSYTLNGARCRLTDVIEVLSDTGLGKESHSVISQGRVDAIVTSKPRDRRLLIEEAAGLGKHRKRRRRAQLKLERTQENLDRALDVEREARTRLRPLKRQAEAADLHERLELQTLQLRLRLAREAVRERRVELQGAERRVAAQRRERERVEARLRATGERRSAAERALSERAERHDARAGAVFQARSAHERIELRAEQAAGAARALAARIARVERELGQLGDLDASEPPAPLEGAGATAPGEQPERAAAEEVRLQRLQDELARLRAEQEQELARESSELASEHERHGELVAEAKERLARAREALAQTDGEAEAARGALAEAERAAQQARRESERVGAELAAVNQYLRAHPRLGAASGSSVTVLGEELRVQEGYELALAAALGGRLEAALVEDLAAAGAVLDDAGPDGGTVLVASRSGAGAAPAPERAPAAGARGLLELLAGSPAAMELARRLLADAWVVDDLRALSPDFKGIAVTRAGRVWFASLGEVRQLAEGGSERLLERRNERDRLIAAVEIAAAAEHGAAGTRAQADVELRGAEERVAAAGAAVREVERACDEADEAQRRSGWLLQQRREAPAHGELAVRIAELDGELAAERRVAAQREQERYARRARIARLRAQLAADGAAAPLAERLSAALRSSGEVVRERVAVLEQTLEEDRRAGELMTAELSACAAQESEIQTALRAAGETVTEAEVAAQRLRDVLAEGELELGAIVERLGADASGEPEPEALDAEEAESLRERLARLARRRELLGPVNPLAQDEYREAVAHVEELEGQRGDLEAALRELRGVIRETDRQIQQTFEQTFAAAARNFSELVGDVFPGGSGALRLVDEERTPSPVLGGAPAPHDAAETEAAGEEAADAEAEAEAALLAGEEQELPGVEIEITPAGKATKRLSLLSGGEKSMTALAFLFAVFLARPCPFYILDEVEAALDDLNLERFLALLRRYSDRAQFIVITHQKRTMEAADWLYGVSMGADGVSKVISRRLPAQGATREVAEVA